MRRGWVRGRWLLAIGAFLGCSAGLSAYGLHVTGEARKALVDAARPAPGEPAPPSPSPSPGSPRILRTPGGDVMAGCDGDRVQIRYLSPAAGFHIVSADRAPGPESRVTFGSAEGAVRVIVRCTGDGPRADVTGG
jgi:hypothetical protein